LALCALLLAPVMVTAEEPPLVYEGKSGPGRGKHIVLIAGDQEYRSEESIPQLARILAAHHGFKCTVLFPINRKTGEIDPSVTDNIPGLEALDKAELAVLFLRFLELPDEQMKHIIDYTNSGKPIVALRTSTHPFNYEKHKDSPYARYSWRSKSPEGGYGRLVLGETWVNHWGAHQKESTRGVIAGGMEKHAILKGVRDIWGESDVYEITTLQGDAKPLVMGQILTSMQQSSPPKTDKKMMPVAWTKTYTGESGKAARIFTTTMGHVGDFTNEGFRRMVVNACYWGLGMEKKIKARGNVDIVGEYKPSPIGFAKGGTGKKPSDLRM
jgi:type 1 glutamine amidotransferase